MNEREREPTPMIATLALVGALAVGHVIGAFLRVAMGRAWSEGFAAGTRADRILERAATADPLPVEV